MTTVADLVLTEHIGKRIAVETPLPMTCEGQR